MAQHFQQYLIGAASNWFLGLENSEQANWVDIVREFTAQYKYNAKVDVTRRDLEITK